MNNQNNQQTHTQSHTQYVQTFNEGYSKACFNIGFSQGYNSGYQAGINQGYWNSQIQTKDACVGPESNSLPQMYKEKIEQYEQDKHDEHYEQDEQGEQDEHSNSIDNVFDDNMEIDFEWYSQDNENDPLYTPLYDSSSTIWNVVKTDVEETEGLRQNMDMNNTFNSHEPISWNVIKEEPKLEENYQSNLFDNKYTTDPFGDYRLDSQIFSSFSWGDILTHNIDIFENNNTTPDEYNSSPSEDTILMSHIPTIPTTIDYSTFPVIQEYSEDEYDGEEEETDEETDEENEDDNSWVYVSETKEKTKEETNDSTDIDSYSFNFDSFTSDDARTPPPPEYNYTAKTCDEISLDSSISSESIAEGAINFVSVSIPSLPSLETLFDDNHTVTYYNPIQSNPACQLPNMCPQSPIQRVTSKR
jgi:hypothetical protein